MNVVVQVFAYKEPDLYETLDALAAQNVPPGYDISYEAWVTPSGQMGSCGTWRQADQHPVFNARVASEGKLSARNDAHAAAVESGGDIVVAWDADAPPLKRGALGSLITPFEEFGVAATNSRPQAPWTPVGAVTNIVGWAHDKIQPHFNGQAHAFSAGAWEHAGPFAVDSQSGPSTLVRAEEEFAFRRRVEGVGRVVDVPDARVHNDNRRSMCWVTEPFSVFGTGADPYCDRLSGDVTFEPRATEEEEEDESEWGY